jgi:hypothetical protein
MDGFWKQPFLLLDLLELLGVGDFPELSTLLFLNLLFRLNRGFQVRGHRPPPAVDGSARVSS